VKEQDHRTIGSDTMTTQDITINEMASTCYFEGAQARVYGKPGDCPYPNGSGERAFWIDGWTHFDELNGGGPRVKASAFMASFVAEPRFRHFFVVPVVEKNGAPALANGGNSGAPTKRRAPANC
jgi:hypothetical protein